jgi:Ran GTPase-activating protein (RanGAP) involved in mRNA processing and transport
LPEELEELNLSHNPCVGVETARNVCEWIKNSKPSTLKVLELESCRILDSGVELISDTIVSGSPLSFLNISDNKIKEAGALYLSECLKDNIHLKILFIRWNHLGLKGGRCIADAL